MKHPCRGKKRRHEDERHLGEVVAFAPEPGGEIVRDQESNGDRSAEQRQPDQQHQQENPPRRWHRSGLHPPQRPPSRGKAQHHGAGSGRGDREALRRRGDAEQGAACQQQPDGPWQQTRHRHSGRKPGPGPDSLRGFRPLTTGRLVPRSLPAGLRIDIAQARLQLVRALEPLLPLLFQSAEHHLVQPRIARRLLARRGEAAEREFAGEHLVKHHAEAVEVGAVVDLVRPLDLLRCDVGGGTQNAAGPGEREVHPLVARDPRDPEVGDLHAALRI